MTILQLVNTSTKYSNQNNKASYYFTLPNHFLFFKTRNLEIADKIFTKELNLIQLC